MKSLVVKSRGDEIRRRRVKSCLRKIIESLIIRLQDKNNRKNFALLQSCFKTAFLKKIPKGPFVEKIENEIFLLY